MRTPHQPLSVINSVGRRLDLILVWWFLLVHGSRPVDRLIDHSYDSTLTLLSLVSTTSG